jgi:hypothetical protein
MKKKNSIKIHQQGMGIKNEKGNVARKKKAHHLIM